MKVCYWSLDGTTLCWPRRLLEEGCEVFLYVSKDRKNKIGQGIVPVASSLENWLAWGYQDPATVFLFDCTDAGELADRLRRSGHLVLNGGSFMDRLEKDRHWGEQLAMSCGVLAPPTHRFASITDTIAFLQSNPEQEHGDGGWAWKPDRDIGTDATLVAKDGARIIDHVEQIRRRFGDRLKCILQEKIDGVAVSTARWWNGRAWADVMEGTIENKKLLNGNLGPATGCSFNVVWMYQGIEEQRISEALRWDALAEAFRKHDAPPGLYDINCMLNDKGAWFLEWTPRLGIDSEMTSQRAISNLSEFVWNMVRGQGVEHLVDAEKCYFDVRLTVPPYPNDVKADGYKSPAIGVPIRGIDGLAQGMFCAAQIAYAEDEGFHVADGYGLVGYVVKAGNSMKRTYDEIYSWIKDELDIPDVQYRTDAAKVLQDDVTKMHDYGWPTTPVLRR